MHGTHNVKLTLQYDARYTQRQIEYFPLLEFVFLHLKSVIDVYKCASRTVMVGHEEWCTVVLRVKVIKG